MIQLLVTYGWEAKAHYLNLLPDHLLSERSKLSHAWVEQLSDKVFEYELRYIDCPVTSLPDMAERSGLTLLVGADLADLAHANSFIKPLSDHIIHFGPVGCGTAYKLMINPMGAVQIATAVEELTIAESAGLDLGYINSNGSKIIEVSRGNDK